MRRRDVSEALGLWGKKPKQVTRVRDVFKVRTEDGTYCLKPTGTSEKRLLFFDSVLRYVQSQGFTALAPYILTEEGHPVAHHAGECLILTPWVLGKEISYRKPKDMIAAAEQLGRFHQAAIGYRPEPGIKVKDKLGRLPEKLARQAGDIEYYAELAEQSQSEFDQYFLKHLEWIHQHTVDAFHAIRDSAYYALVAESDEIVHICHGDPSKRNFIKTPSGELYMIDFESMKADLPVVDLWRLIRRLLARDQWEMGLVQAVIAGYEQGRKLDREEYELLLILLSFPEKVWRTLQEYYEKRGRSDWSESKLLKRLRHLMGQSKAMDHFLAVFEKEFLG